MSARNRKGICAYCGKEKKVTSDHVPPKLFLELPRPLNLWTVPACGDCNTAFKADDEYTRTVLAMDVRATWNYAAQSNLSSILRSLQYPKARGFAEYLASQSQTMKVLAPNGGPVTRIEKDRLRIAGSGMHIIRGLYFRETRRPLAYETADVRLSSIAGLVSDDPPILGFARVFHMLLDKRDGALGSAFSYTAAFGHNRSVWLMVLYDYFFWMGTIDERDIAEREADEAAVAQ